MSEVLLHVSDISGFFDKAADEARRIDGGSDGAASAEIAFHSMELLLKSLTPNRWRLLKSLKTSGATSIRRLARELGRDYRGVHADVRALMDIGLVEKTPDGMVMVPWDRIVAEMSLDAAA